jgi:hypothetical protein
LDGFFTKGNQTMALVTAYLARTAQRSAGRATASAARSFFSRIARFFRIAGEAVSEAQELRRSLTAKHPFIDI